MDTFDEAGFSFTRAEKKLLEDLRDSPDHMAFFDWLPESINTVTRRAAYSLRQKHLVILREDGPYTEERRWRIHLILYRDPALTLAENIWDILTVVCKAPRQIKPQFFTWFASDSDELRFCGNLGIGGKVWHENIKPIRVSCYPEDEKRYGPTVDLANLLLNELCLSVGYRGRTTWKENK